MRRLDVSSEAELEVFAAALKYERERPGLGFRFEADVNGVFARLLENPYTWKRGRIACSARRVAGITDPRDQCYTDAYVD
jgi:hypothetical protein